MEKTFKIALIVYSLSEGGLERVVSNSSFLFQEMRCEVYLYVLNSKVDYPFTGILYRFYVGEKRGFQKIKTYLGIYKSFKKHKFDLIIDHRYRLNFLSEFFWQKFLYNKQHVINYIHSSHLKNYLFKSKIINSILFGKRVFICVSHGIEKKVNEIFPKLHTKTLYNYIEPLMLLNDERAVGERYIMAVGRMEPSNVKQIDVLLKIYAASELPQRNIKLFIFGNGNRLQDMKNLASDLNLNSFVDFKGFVPDISGFLKQALFTVLTSKYEGLPTILIESLMMGTPVVSFDCETGPREIIQNGINGLLIENQNVDLFITGVNFLVKDKMFYERLKKNSQDSIEQFRKKKILKQWMELFNDIH